MHLRGGSEPKYHCTESSRPLMLAQQQQPVKWNLQTNAKDTRSAASVWWCPQHQAACERQMRTSPHTSDQKPRTRTKRQDRRYFEASAHWIHDVPRIWHLRSHIWPQCGAFRWALASFTRAQGGDTIICWLDHPLSDKRCLPRQASFLEGSPVLNAG